MEIALTVKVKSRAGGYRSLLPQGLKRGGSTCPKAVLPGGGGTDAGHTKAAVTYSPKFPNERGQRRAGL